MTENVLTSDSAWPELDGCWSGENERLDVFEDDDPTPVIIRRPTLPIAFPPPQSSAVPGPPPAGLDGQDVPARGGAESNATPTKRSSTRWWTRVTRARSRHSSPE